MRVWMSVRGCRLFSALILFINPPVHEFFSELRACLLGSINRIIEKMKMLKTP